MVVTFNGSNPQKEHAVLESVFRSVGKSCENMVVAFALKAAPARELVLCSAGHEET